MDRNIENVTYKHFMFIDYVTRIEINSVGYIMQIIIFMYCRFDLMNSLYTRYLQRTKFLFLSHSVFL
jgi:hypothetical protein